MTDYKAELFPKLEARAYLNHSSISPLNQRAVSAVNALMSRFQTVGAKAWVEGMACRKRVRESLGRLLQCPAEALALISNTTHGLQIVAHEFPWQTGDRLVLVKGEFPGNVAPWLLAAKRFQLEVLWLAPEDLAGKTPLFHQVMAQKPRLLAVSWVQYQTGFTLSPADLSALREDHGVAVCVDAIQGLGALKLNLEATPLDFVVCGGHKWMLSPEGTGLIYVNPELMPRMRPLLVGWLSQEDPASFLFRGAGYVDYHKPYRLDTTRYEQATMNNFGFAGMEASVNLFLEVGPDEVQRRVTDLAAYCRAGLRALDFPVHEQHTHAGVVSFPLEAALLEHYFRELDGMGVSVAVPDGHLRVSAHFYNDRADIDLFLESVQRIREARG